MDDDWGYPYVGNPPNGVFTRYSWGDFVNFHGILIIIKLLGLETHTEGWSYHHFSEDLQQEMTIYNI